MSGFLQVGNQVVTQGKRGPVRKASAADVKTSEATIVVASSPLATAGAKLTQHSGDADATDAELLRRTPGVTLAKTSEAIIATVSSSLAAADASSLQLGSVHDVSAIATAGSARGAKLAQQRDGSDADRTVTAESAHEFTQETRQLAVESPVSFFQVESVANGESGSQHKIPFSRGHGAQSWSSTEVLFALSVFLLLAVACISFVQSPYEAPWWLPYARPPAATSVRQRTEGLSVTRGSEIASLFGISEEDEEKLPASTVSPGGPMRVQGRILRAPEAAPLIAPFSNRQCVMYSASVAHRRLDGVHQPPVAYNSATSDFVLELADAPEVLLTIHGQDVALFDMVEGSHSCEHSFSDAPDVMRGFTLAHLATGVGLSGQQGLSLSSANELDFCECALPVGATVTCVGEIVKDRMGGLGLLPWRPPLAEQKPNRRKMLSWQRSPGADGQKDGVVGRVVVSDDPMLLEVKSWQPLLS